MLRSCSPQPPLQRNNDGLTVVAMVAWYCYSQERMPSSAQIEGLLSTSLEELKQNDLFVVDNDLFVEFQSYLLDTAERDLGYVIASSGRCKSVTKPVWGRVW